MHIKRRNDSKEIQRMEKRGGEMLSIDQVNNLEAENKKLKEALVSIRNFIKNDICEACKELEEDHCDECAYKIILEEVDEVIPA